MTVQTLCRHGKGPICLQCAAEAIGLPHFKPGDTAFVPNDLDVTVKTRDARYGGFENVADICQQFKRIMQKSPSYGNMNDVQKEGMEMVLHKCARLLSGDPTHRDSWHDIQGYAKLVEDRLPPEMISTPIIRQPLAAAPRADGFSIDGT